MKTQRKSRILAAAGATILSLLSLISCKNAISAYDDFRDTIDNTTPSIDSVSATSNTSIEVRYSEPVDSGSAENSGSYFIQGTPVINVTEASLSDNNKVVLTVSSGMVTGRTYKLSVAGISDLNDNSLSSQTIDFTGMGIVVAHLYNTPAALTNSSGISIDVQVDGDGDGSPDGTDSNSYKYRMDNGAWSDELREDIDIVDTEITAQGQDEAHSIEVLARNAQGRWQDEPTAYTWRIDRKGPDSGDMTVSGLPASVTAINSAEITVGGQEIATYKYRFANDSWSDEIQATNKISLDDLAGNPPEDYTIQIIGRDMAGNWQSDSAPYAYTWRVNLTDPVAEIADVPDAYTGNDGISISVGGSEITNYQYRIDGGSWSEWKAVAQNIRVDGLSEAVHTIEVLGRNNAGREQDISSPTTYSWTVDMTPPSKDAIVLSNIPDDPSNGRTANIGVSGADVFWYRYRLDYSENGETVGGTMSGRYPVSDSISLSSNDLERDGVYTLYVIGVDRALNETPYTLSNLKGTSQWHEWKLDTSVPVADLSGEPASLTSSRTTDITVSGENVIAYKYRIDGGDWSGQTAAGNHIELSGLDHGNHDLDVIALNSAGTWQSETNPATCSWEVDITAPETVLSGLPSDGLFNFAHVNVLENTNEGDMVVSYKYRYRLQSGSWIGGDVQGWSAERSVDQRIDLSSLTPDKTYLLEVIGRDDAGNWQGDASVAYPTEATSYSWTVGLAGFPVAELFDDPLDPTGNDTLNARVAGTGVTSYRYRIDGGAWCGEKDISARITDTVAEGEHTLSVIGYDGSNWQPEAIATEIRWSVDLTPPAEVTAAMTSPDPAVEEGGVTAAKDFTFSIGGADVSHYSFRYYNGTSWTAWSDEAPVSSPLSLSDMPGNPQTEYTLQVRGRDAQGNWMATSSARNISWNVDREAPAVPAVNDDSMIYDTDLYVDFYWTDDSGIADREIQIATDSSFSLKSIVYEGGTTDTDHHRYQVSTGDGSSFYAHIRVRDSLGNWSDWGTCSDGIDLVGSVTGMIVNGLSTSSGIAGASVTLVDTNDPDDPDDNTDIATVNSGSDGSFAFDQNVPIGANRYNLRVEKAGYHSAAKNNISVTVGSTTDCGSVYLIETSATASNIAGTVIDANWGNKIDNATVELLDSDSHVVSAFTESTASDGSFTMSSVNPGTYSVSITKSGFYPLVVNNIVVDGRNGDENLGRQAICQNLAPYQIRVTVQWGANPQDLDLHVTGPSSHSVKEESGNSGSTNNRFHVFYRNQKSFNETVTSGYYSASGDPNGSSSTTSLVQDTTAGYGPEAINIFKNVGDYAGGLYKFSVHDYSHTNWYASTIVMRVYNQYGLIREISFPGGAGSQYLWKAIRITVSSASKVVTVDDIAVINAFANINKSFPVYQNRDKTVFDW